MWSYHNETVHVLTFRIARSLHPLETMACASDGLFCGRIWCHVQNIGPLLTSSRLCKQPCRSARVSVLLLHILGDLADKGLSSSSSGGGLTLATLGEEAMGVLVLEEMGKSSSSLGAVALTGANLGEVALRGDFA